MVFTSIAIGSCVLLAYPISGGCLNPAVGVGSVLLQIFWPGPDSLQGNFGHKIASLIVYAATPLAGGFLAILFYETYYKRILDESEETNVLDKFFEG